MEGVKEIYENGFWRNATDDQGRTGLHLAAMFDHKDLIAYFLGENDQKKVFIDSKLKCENGFTALHYAVYYGNLGAVGTLLRYKVSRDSISFGDLTPHDLCLERIKDISFYKNGVLVSYEIELLCNLIRIDIVFKAVELEQ